MKRILILAFAAPTAFGQTFPDRVSPADMQSGSPQGWTANAISLTYEVPEPVGLIELEFIVRVEPQVPLLDFDRLRLIAGNIGYRDGGTINLPSRLLECLPYPRPREASLTILYIEPSNDNDDWFSQFTSYITIPFGRHRGVSVRDTEFLEYASVEFAVTGTDVRRAAFMKATGEKNVFEPVSDSCPSELVSWALE